MTTACTPPLTRGSRQGEPATGSMAGYRRHQRASEPPCPECRRARREARRTPARSPATVPGYELQVFAAVNTVVELYRMNRVGPADAARVETVLGLAEQVDNDPLNAAIWAVYRRALTALLQTTRTD